MSDEMDDMDAYTGHRDLERRERIEALADHIEAILRDLVEDAIGPTRMPARYRKRDLAMMLAEIGVDVEEMKHYYRAYVLARNDGAVEA